MPKPKYTKGQYVKVYWEEDNPSPAHYVAGHVTLDVFRSSVEQYTKGKVTVPADATLEHVYVRSVRVDNDRRNNYQFEWRHVLKSHAVMAMTYWELQPTKNTGA